VLANADELATDYAVTPIEQPDDVAATTRTIETLPTNWDAGEPTNDTRDIGMEWAKSLVTVILAVPSVVIPRECGYIVNPRHPDFPRVRGKRPLQRGEQIFNRRIIAKRTADVDITVHSPRPKHEAATELKGILSQLMLPVPARARSVAGALVVAPQHVQQVRIAQAGGAISLALLIDQQGEPNPGFLPEQARIVRVAESDGRQVGAPLAEGLFVCAQLRDVLAAEDSTVVAQEDHHRRLSLPQRSHTDLLAIRIGQYDRRERLG